MPDQWLENHRVTTMWSNPHADAVAFAELPKHSYFLQREPRVASRMFVHFFGNRTSPPGDIWVDAEDLGPIPGRPDRPEPDWSEVYAPALLIKTDVRAGTFAQQPKGVVLHGSRSGSNTNTMHQEFVGTANFALNTELGWNATVGHDEIAIHLAADAWGHHARAASRKYLSVELAQPKLGSPLTDGQVRAFCWWMRKFVLVRWPDLPMHFPTHSEVENNGETEHFDGKTDIFKWQDAGAANAFRQQILDRLADRSWSV